MLDQIAAALGAKKGVVVAAGIGAFIAALIKSRLQDRDKEPRSWLEIFITMFGGFFGSVYATEPLLAYLEWKSNYEHGVAFFVGLFAMTLIDKILSMIKVLDWELVKGFFRK